MNDDDILERGGDQHDIESYARHNGADLTKEDFTPQTTNTDEHVHNQRFWGDDPYLICDCGKIWDALTGKEIVSPTVQESEGVSEDAPNDTDGLREAIGKKLGWWHGSDVHIMYKEKLNKLMALIAAKTTEAQDVGGLIERRQEVYQIWVWACEAHNKGLVSRDHRGYVYMLYRRYNDLTDQLQQLTGSTKYVHYEMDQKTMKPVELQALSEKGEK